MRVCLNSSFLKNVYINLFIWLISINLAIFTKFFIIFQEDMLSNRIEKNVNMKVKYENVNILLTKNCIFQT